MICQFIPPAWPIFLPAFFIAGLPITIAFYVILSRFVRSERPNFVTAALVAASSISLTVIVFYFLNFCSWRLIEDSTPSADDLLAASRNRVTETEFIQRFGEPDERELSNSGNDTLVYDAILKYSDGSWGIGMVSIEFDSSGKAVDTRIAD